MAVRLGRFMEHCGVLPTTQFAYRKGLGTCDVLLRKTKTMIVSRSRTMHPQSPLLTVDGTVLKESDDLDILGVTFDSKLTFEKHLRSVSRAASQRLGILRQSWRVFHDKLLIGRCFSGFVLPVFEYCSAVWCSAADTHLKLLDSIVSGACF